MKVKIPHQLREKGFRFIRLKPKSKIPVDKWQSVYYSHDDPRLLQHLGEGGNYGLICGGGLIVIDADTEKIKKIIDKKFAKTLTVKTAKGTHFYFYCVDFSKKKVLTDGGIHLGEIQSTGTFVVAPNSVHPSGKVYTVVSDSEIAEVGKSQIEHHLGKFFSSERINKNVIIDGAPQGLRNTTMFKLACSFRGNKLTFTETLAAVRAINAKNTPPLPDGEIRAVVASAYRYSESPEPTVRDQKEIEKFLKNPSVFEKLNEELDKTIVEEHQTRKAILLIAAGGSRVINAEGTSLNLMVNDVAGAGKDYLVKQVLKLLPSGWVVIRKRLTEKVLTYWHNAKFEPTWSWDGKILYLEDISNNVLNSDVFKVYSSAEVGGESISQVLINQIPVEVKINGKPAIIITIASASPKPELLRRYPITNLDTTEAQTKLILRRKAEFHSKGIKPSYDPFVVECLSKLQRVKVKVGFAGKLVDSLGTKHIIIRTHFDRFIDYIKFSCALHQYQRKQDEDGYLLAESQDYEIAKEALLQTTSNLFCIPLTRNQQRILDILQSLDQNLSYSVSELEPKVTFCSERTLRFELDRLSEYGFLYKTKEERGTSSKPVMVYQYQKISKLELPSKDRFFANASTPSTASLTSTTTTTTNG